MNFFTTFDCVRIRDIRTSMGKKPLKRLMNNNLSDFAPNSKFTFKFTRSQLLTNDNFAVFLPDFVVDMFSNRDQWTKSRRNDAIWLTSRLTMANRWPSPDCQQRKLIDFDNPVLSQMPTHLDKKSKLACTKG